MQIKKYGILLLVFLPVLAFGKTFEVQTLNMNNNQSMVFDPMFLKIEAGDTVKFIPKDDGHAPHSVFTPEKGETWKSKSGEEVSVTFSKEGVYIHECQNHALMGMAGIIQVGPPHNLDEAKKFYSKYKNKFIMHKDRLDGFLDKITKTRPIQSI